jgi:hypothetical protein
VLTNNQIINNFYAQNKIMIGLSATTLASLLVIAPFNSGSEFGLTRKSAIQFFLLWTALGKMADFVNEPKV